MYDGRVNGQVEDFVRAFGNVPELRFIVATRLGKEV